MNVSSPEQTLKSRLGERGVNGRTRSKAVHPVRRLGLPRRANRLTMEGAMFIGLTLLIGLAAVNSGHNLLYLIFSVMLAMLLVSGHLARNNMRGVIVQRRFPLEFHAGESVPAFFEVQNNERFFTSYALRVQDFMLPESFEEEDPFAFQARGFQSMVRPGQTARCTTTLELQRRGLYRLHSIQLISRYPFGFFQRSRRFDLPGQLLVLPRMLPPGQLLPLLTPALGDQMADRRGSGASLYGIRNYQSGDPARHIHWKHSAKGQGLKLKEFEEERTLSFRLMLDLRCTLPLSPQQMELFETAISVTATLARYFLQRDCSVSLWTTWGRVPMGFGRLQLQRILRALACVQPQAWDADIPFIENEPAEVTSLCMVFQDDTEMPEGFERGYRLPSNTLVIDVRRLDLPGLQQQNGRPMDGR